MSRYSRAETTVSSFADADWDLIERIIDTVPDGATGFSELSAAYDKIMEESGFDTQDDPTHFRLLLKIHEMRAPTLRGRLEKWRSGNRSVSAGTDKETTTGEVDDTHEVESFEVSYEDPQPRRRNPLVDSDADNVRKKIPFLAEAGSDPDEGDGDDELDQRGLTDKEAEISVDYQEGTSSVSDTATADYPPFRTPKSHDIPATYAGPVGVARYSSTPFGRDVKTAPPNTNVYETPLRPSQRQRTPSTAHSSSNPNHSLTISTPPIRALQSGRDEEYLLLEDEAFEMERVHEVELGRGEEFRKMQKEADEFYNYGLKSRSMREWMRELEWEKNDLNELIDDLDQARLSRDLDRWRAAKAMHDRLGDLASRTHRRATQGESFRRWAMRAKRSRIERNCDRWVERKEMELMEDAWRGWKDQVDRRAKRKWQEEMMEKELVVREKDEQRVERKFFAKWRTARNIRRADRHRGEVVVRHALQHWQSRTLQSVVLRANEEQLSNTWEQRLALSVFQKWRRDTRLRVAELDVSDMVDDRIEAKAWTLWRSKFGKEQAASNHYRLGLLRTTFPIWSDRMGRVKRLAQVSFKVKRGKQAAMVSTAFRVWRNMARSNELERKRTVCTLRSTFASWTASLSARQDCELLAENFDNARQTVALKGCVQRWRQKHDRISMLSRAADLSHDQYLLKKTFQSWHSSSNVVAAATVRSDVLRAFFLERRGFKSWVQRYRRRKQVAWVDAKRMEVVKTFFEVWREAKKREDNLKVHESDWQERSDKRVASATLNVWLKRVVELKSAEYEVKVKYDGKLAKSAFSSWTNAVLRQGEALSLSQSFRDVRDEATRRRLFVFWLVSARESKSQKQKLDVYRRQQQQTDLKTAFAQWRWKLRQLQLQPVEAQVTLHREDALLFAAFDTWKSKSRRLPAIAFERSISKRKTWDTWIRALPKARMLREVSQKENRVVLDQFFGKWNMAYRSKVARRASARQRGSSGLLRFRPSLGGSVSAGSDTSPIMTTYNENRRSSRRRSGLFAPSGSGSVC